MPSAFPRKLDPSRPLLLDLAYYFPLWTIEDLRITRLRPFYYQASWTALRPARGGQRRYELMAAGITVVDMENRILEVMRKRVDPQNRVPFVRCARNV